MKTMQPIEGVAIHLEDDTGMPLTAGPDVLGQIAGALRGDTLKVYLNRHDPAKKGKWSDVRDLAGVAKNFRVIGGVLRCDILTRIGDNGATLAADANSNHELIRAVMGVRGNAPGGRLSSVTSVAKRINIVPAEQGLPGGLFEAKAALDFDRILAPGKSKMNLDRIFR